jgi:hypothetical protein
MLKTLKLPAKYRVYVFEENEVCFIDNVGIESFGKLE